MGYEVVTNYATPLVFKMVSTDDGVTPMPGLSPLPTVQVSKYGNALSAAGGAVSEIGGGWYKLAASGTYGTSDSFGPLLLVATATGARGSDVYWMAIAIDSLVWDGPMGDHAVEDSIGCAMWNAFRGYNRTEGLPHQNAHADGVPAGTVGLRLTPAGLDQVVVETGVNARQALALIGAATAGKASGLATTTATFYAMGASGTTTVRIVAGTDASGNRATTTLTPPT